MKLMYDPKSKKKFTLFDPKKVENGAVRELGNTTLDIPTWQKDYRISRPKCPCCMHLN